MSILGYSVPTILLVAIAVAGFLVYAPFTIAAYARFRIGFTREMLATPRATTNQLPAYAQRAVWAHQNSWEAFILFSVAALMAYITHQNSLLVAGAAMVFLLARSFYSVFYILDIPVLRSLMFATGSVCIAILFGSSILGSIAL